MNMTQDHIFLYNMFSLTTEPFEEVHGVVKTIFLTQGGLRL